jgi:hypothetical protein
MVQRGLFAVGRLVSIDQVKYGPNHPTSPSAPVVGLFEIRVDLSSPDADEPMFFRASFFETAGASKTRIADDLDGLDVSDSPNVRVRYGVKDNNGRSRFTAYGIERIAEDDQADEVTGRRRTRPLAAS